MSCINKILFCILILFNLQTLSLEITVPVKIYQPLSKSSIEPIAGSSITILYKEDLNQFKNLPIHDILNIKSGINTRSIYGSNSSGSKTSIDIRGMGAQAKSNVLIMINGQRLNNIDMSEIDFPSIPFASIDKIEIIKGNAASVLYGDGAIGGAINIITNPEYGIKNLNEIIFKSGTFNNKEIIFNNSQYYNKFSLNTYFNHFETDGYRDENEQQQNNVTSEIRYKGDKGDHFIAINFSEQIMSTPSDRNQDQLFEDRKGSDTPDDYINSEGGSLIYSKENKFDDSMTLIINSSFRIKESYSDLQSTSYPSYNETTLTNYQISPRIDSFYNFFAKNFFSTYGVDIQYADYKSYRKKSKNVIPLHYYTAWQSSQSLYLQNSLEISKKTKLGSGFRIQRSEIDIGDKLNVNAPNYTSSDLEHSKYQDEDINYAFNLGINYQINQNTSFFSRIGNGFRYPNIDDRIGGSGDTLFNLNTQKSRDYEIGSEIKFNNFSSVFSLFLIENQNELAYDSDNYVNANLPSTRRFGLEAEIKNKIFDNLIFKNNFSFSKAKYTADPSTGGYGSTVYNNSPKLNGNDIPLVPEYSLYSILEWNIFDSTNLVTSLKFQDDMRMESDDENFQDTKIPSYLIANMNLNTKIKKYDISLQMNNIFNQNYYNYAVSSSNTLGSYNAYPEPGAEFILSIGTNF